MTRTLVFFLIGAALLASMCAADSPIAPASQPGGLDPPADFIAIDRPSDAGQAILLSWRKMPREGADLSYEIWMGEVAAGPMYRQARIKSLDVRTQANFPGAFGLGKRTADFRAHEISKFLHPSPADPSKMVNTALDEGKAYCFRVVAARADGPVAQTPVQAATPVSNWFAFDRTNVLVAMLFVAAAVLFFVWVARRHPESIFIRRIPGLESVDEALGRAAEMGKPIYFCHGLGGVDMVVTVSSVNLLGKIAEHVAEYGADMKVTCFDYIVQQVSQEMVKEACIRVGRPDAYREDNIFYVSSDSFAYATAVEGMLLREKPATCFFFGQFMSEALLLAETGAVTKAIQIAGTDNWTQIPFFITTCDYTLIGEELYAASAYLSREPRLLGTVKGQDAIKAVIIVAILAGAGLAAFGIDWLAKLFKVLN